MPETSPIVDKALAAVDAVFSDTSVCPRGTWERLTDLISHIETLRESLDIEED